MIELPTLGYGAAAAGNLYRALDDDAARELLDTVWDTGIRYFDTAPHYGLGLSERRLGAMLRERPRSQYVLSTKAGRLLEESPQTAGQRDDDIFEVPATHRRRWDFSPAGIRRSLEESLERLGLDRVDIIYLHDPEVSDQPVAAAVDRGLDALAALRDEGLVTAIGVGTADLDVIDRAVRTGLVDLVMLAGRYTLLEAPAADHVVPLCRERGVGIVNAAVFNSGLLAAPTPRADSHYRYGDVPPDKLARARQLARVCERFEVPLPAAAMQFGLREPAVRSVVVGAGRPDQVRENVARMELAIPEELWDALATEGLMP